MRIWDKITVAASAFVILCNAQLIALTEAHSQKDNQFVIEQDFASMAGGNVILADILGSQKAISIFASFTRDVATVADRLESQTTNTTLLAPVNSAISSLPRKPWETPQDYARLGTQAYHGNDGSERAEKNLQRFVEAHVVPASPWEKGQKVKTMAGEEIWWENKDGKMVVMPGNIEIERVAKQVGNGEVWIIEKVINYA